MSFISRAKPFAHLDRLLAWQQGAQPAPVTVEVDLSNVCSLGCQSCHFAHTHVAGPWASVSTEKPHDYRETGRFADPEVFTRAFAEMAAAGVQGVVFSGGGEPTLHPSFVTIARTAHAAGLQLGLYTLGGHLDLGRLSVVRECFAWVVVSLDAPNAETYAREKRVPASRFDQACAGIRALSGGPVVGASFLLHADNWTRTAEMIALARSLGATYTSFRPTIETSPAQPSVLLGDRAWVTDAFPELLALGDQGDVEIDVDRFLEFADWTGHRYAACHGIKMVSQITPDGRMWVCPNRRGMPGSELGDLRVESFADIWARHPGQWTDFSDCRAMCRLNQINESLAPVFAPLRHKAFV